MIAGKDHNEYQSFPIRSLTEEHFRKGESKESSKQEETKDSFSPRSQSLISLFREIFRQSLKYRLAATISALAYWLLYGYSSGMFFYYSFDVTASLKESGMTNPYFISTTNLAGVYYDGVVWFPTSHLQFDFLLGPTFFSVLLSSLFSLSILLLVYSFRFKGLSKKRQGFMGLFGMMPAIFSGGCCAVPIGTVLLGPIVPLTALADFEFGNPFLMNLLIALLMLSSIIYVARKIIKTRACEVSNVD
jgi:hypothetical protein